jgi:hypothetical protein
MNFVQSLGCIACAKDGYHGSPAQLHHPRSGVGMSERGNDKDVIPLCIHHHLRPSSEECHVYPTGDKIISIHDDVDAFREKYGSEEVLVRIVRKSVKSILSRSIGTRRA